MTTNSTHVDLSERYPMVHRHERPELSRWSP